MSVNTKKMCGQSGWLKITGRRAVVLAVCFALLPLISQAQTGSQQSNQTEANRAALELKLVSYTTRVCLRSSVTLSLEATNTSEQEIKIYKPDLWSRFAYSVAGSEYAGTSIACGGGDNSPESWIVLAPGAKYYDTLTYQLEWNSFFQKVGSYKISTSLPYYVAGKQVRELGSNAAEFEIYDCEAK